MNFGLALIAFAGRRLMDLFGYLGEIVIIITHGCSQLLGSPLTMNAVARMVLWKQVQFTGVDAVPFTALLASLTALSVVVQVQVVGLGQTELWGKLLVVVLVRELGPMIVALIVLARSGTAIATELSTMRVAGEIRSLSLGGIDPFTYLVIPRLGGLAVSTFCLSQVFIGISLLGGYVACLLILTDPPALSEYVGLIKVQLSASDALLVAVKTVVPGLLIGAIACREGLSCGMSYTEIPRATTRAVVRAFTAIFCWDALVTTVVYVVGR